MLHHRDHGADHHDADHRVPDDADPNDGSTLDRDALYLHADADPNDGLSHHGHPCHGHAQVCLCFAALRLLCVVRHGSWRYERFCDSALRLRARQHPRP